jgi:hypothetical protein
MVIIAIVTVAGVDDVDLEVPDEQDEWRPAKNS